MEKCTVALVLAYSSWGPRYRLTYSYYS